MKKIILIFIVLLLMTSFDFAVKIGDPIGDVLYTDIVAKMNGVAINSFNINGSTAVYVRELKKLGYDVNWDAEGRSVEVIDNKDKEIISSDMPGILGYTPANQGLTIGRRIGKVLHTDIETYLEGKKVESFNIKGSTAIYVDALTRLGINFVWDSENREVLLTRGPRKQLRLLENYVQVTFNKINGVYVLDHSTLPETIKNNYEGYTLSTSNLFTEAFSDEALFQRNYTPLKESIYKEEGQVKINPADGFTYTIISLYDASNELLGIIQLPRKNDLTEESFELNLYNPNDYDYESIIAEKKNYIRENIEKSQKIQGNWFDIIYKPEKNEFAFFVNTLQLPDGLQREAYYLDAIHYDYESFSGKSVEVLLTIELSRLYFNDYDDLIGRFYFQDHASLKGNHVSPVTGINHTVDEDSVVLLTLRNDKNELIGYKKTNFNELMNDVLIGSYQQVKVIPLASNEEAVVNGLLYDGKDVNPLGDNLYGPFKAPVDLDKIELDVDYKELLIEAFDY